MRKKHSCYHGDGYREARMVPHTFSIALSGFVTIPVEPDSEWKPVTIHSMLYHKVIIIHKYTFHFFWISKHFTDIKFFIWQLLFVWGHKILHIYPNCKKLKVSTHKN